MQPFDDEKGLKNNNSFIVFNLRPTWQVLSRFVNTPAGERYIFIIRSKEQVEYGRQGSEWLSLALSTYRFSDHGKNATPNAVFGRKLHPKSVLGRKLHPKTLLGRKLHPETLLGRKLHPLERNVSRLTRQMRLPKITHYDLKTPGTLSIIFSGYATINLCFD